jgi:hypothetical protein
VEFAASDLPGGAVNSSSTRKARRMTLGQSWLPTVVLLLTACGCNLYHRPLGAPGTIQTQRLDAVIHDPFVDTNAGPEVVGGRPRDFQRPLTESERSQLVRGR